MPRPQPQPTQPKAFAPGARVIIRDEDWMVRGAMPTSTGGTAVRVTGLSELVRGKDAIFLDDLDDITELRPETTSLVRDGSPRYRRSKLFLESLLRQSPPSEKAIAVGHRGAIREAPYQLVPASMALAQPRPRILMADGVGLGKTIEVGILLSELIRRGRARRILVVALKSVLEQFQEELWARFTIPLVRLDSIGIQRVQRKIPANMNPFYVFDRVIISIDTLKKDEKYRRFLEQCRWDATVIDECQHVAVRTRPGSTRKSQRAQLADLLARTCDALILTSATPHDGRAESFASLMNLLEPTAVANPSSYTQDEIGGLYVRRFKKDIKHQVQGSFKDRRVELHRVQALDEENELLELLAKAEFKTIRVRTAAKGVLFRTLLLKSALSSPDALIQTVDERLKHKALRLESGEAPSEEVTHDRTLLTEIRSLAKKITPAKMTKLKKLITLLRDMGVGSDDTRVVIFSERIATLEMLRKELRKAQGLAADAVAVFHGSLDDTQQQDLVKEFRTQASKVRILLASDAASEGINLHDFCHRMVHFDIPWSLITLEQRNGRIDRYGQQHEPKIDYLLSTPVNAEVRGDLRILEVLIEKEDRAHHNLGDVRWLMKLHDATAEEERIVQAVSLREDPDQVIADPEEVTQDSFLSRLMAAEKKQTEDEASQPRTESALTLYADALQFMKEAAAELSENDDTFPMPAWHDHLQGLTLTAPDDLKRRFAYLPPELRRDGGWDFKLTADRELVQQALDKSREERGAWPEWQLLWDQHPICEWLNDRLMAHFGRHEAPVMRVTKGLVGSESAFLMQGVISNHHSQPVIVDWFVLKFDAKGKEAATLSLREFASTIGLNETMSNDGKTATSESLDALRERAVAIADARMKELRAERGKELRPVLKEERKRLKAWAEKSLLQVEEKRKAAAAAGRTLRKDEQDRLRLREEGIQDTLTKREAWTEKRLATSDHPYLRIAAVFVGGGNGKGAS
jgi:Helicase conserved C-terminal domain/SNF2-related domain